jgi:hypothetical protein
VSVLNAPSFIAFVRALLPTDPRFPGLIIEVTEDEIIRDPQWAREIATQLRLYNVGISIDDFGSAYASLSRLNDLPFNEVKIDRSFVSGCHANKLKPVSDGDGSGASVRRIGLRRRGGERRRAARACRHEVRRRAGLSVRRSDARRQARLDAARPLRDILPVAA